MLKRLPRLTPRRSPAALLALTLIASLILTVTVQISHAQGQELLQNPSFEAYYGIGGGNLAPTGWTLTSNPAVSSSGHTWPGESRTGASWDINAPGTVFVAIGSQFVPGIRSGTKLRFSAWANVFTCNQQNSCIFGSSGHRTSDQTSGARVRIGVDPQGGNDANSANVQWSSYASPFDQFSQLIIDTAAQTNNGVTVYIYATQSAPMLLNHVYWDDASLQVLGDGVALIPGVGAVIATPTSAFAPLVKPQGAQPDGSIVHVVGAGDTLASIAYAYKVTVADIRNLNQMSPDNSILQIGQKLIIKPAGSVSVEATGAATGDAGAAANASNIGPVNASPTASNNSGNTVASQPTVVQPTAEQPTAVQPTAIPPTAVPPTATVAPTATTIPTGNSTDPMGLPLMPLAQVANDQLAKLVLGGANAAPINTQPSVCVNAFDDKNVNRWQDADEKLLPDVTVKLSHAGQPDKTVSTTGDKASCFDAVVPGSYVVMASAPDGYGMTTADDLEVVAQPGAKLALTFGAATGYKPAPVKADSADSSAVSAVNQVPVDSSIDAPATSAQHTTTSIMTTLFSNSGLIVMGLAGVVLVGGLGTIWMFFKH